MMTAKDAAKFFLYLFQYDEDGLTNLKLNKLLYFAQGFSYQRFGRPLFADDFQAWHYGPVIKSVYDEYKEYGRNRIPYQDDFTAVSTDEESELVLDVAREYGKYSASHLTDISHRPGSPWKKVYETGAYEIPISKESIRNYFCSGKLTLKPFEMEINDEDYEGYFDPEGTTVLPKEMS